MTGGTRETTLELVVREGLTDEVKFELRPELNDGMIHGNIWGKVFQSKQRADLKALVGMSMMCSRNRQKACVAGLQ